MGDPVRDHPGLAAPGAGQYQQRPLNVLHCFTLRLCKAIQERVQG